MSTGRRVGPPSRLGRMATPSPSREAVLGTSLGREMILDARPVTQQGLRGSRAPTSSGARMVQDGGYFIGVLRQKIKYIDQEIQLLNSESVQLTRESEIFGGLQNSHRILLEEVKQLKGQLADSNLATDKCRTTTVDPTEVDLFLADLNQRNVKMAATVDEMFIQRRQRESEIAGLKLEMGKCRERLLQSIVPSASHLAIECENLFKCQYTLEVEARMGDEKLEKVRNSIRQLKLTLQQRGVGEDYIELNSQMLKLREEVDLLSQDLEVVKMEPEQARNTLLSRTKAKQEHCQEYERRANKTKQHILSLKQKLYGLDAINQGCKGEVSSDILFVENRQGKEKVDDLQQESEFKTEQQKALYLSGCTVTKPSLHAKKTRGSVELEVKSPLDREISQDLETIVKKSEAITADLRIFGDLDSLQYSAEKTRVHLEGQRDLYINRRDKLRAQVQAESQLHESLKKQIAASDMTVELDRLEGEIKSYETDIFNLQEDIKTRVMDVDFCTLQGNCTAMTEQVNSMIKKCVGAR